MKCFFFDNLMDIEVAIHVNVHYIAQLNRLVAKPYSFLPELTLHKLTKSKHLGLTIKNKGKKKASWARYKNVII